MFVKSAVFTLGAPHSKKLESLHLLGEKMWCGGVAPSTWGHTESLWRGKIRPMRPVEKVKALLSLLQIQDAFCQLSPHPKTLGMDCTVTPLSEKEASRQFSQVFIAFIIKRHHYFLPTELPW